MSRQSIIQKMVLVLIVWIIAGVCAAAGFADGNGDAPIGDKTPQIKEIPGNNSEGTRDFVKEVENQYNFIGAVDDVQKEGIVIGDTYFKIAPGAAISGASKGARVGIILNSNKEIISCEPVKKIRR